MMAVHAPAFGQDAGPCVSKAGERTDSTNIHMAFRNKCRSPKQVSVCAVYKDGHGPLSDTVPAGGSKEIHVISTPARPNQRRDWSEGPRAPRPC